MKLALAVLVVVIVAGPARADTDAFDQFVADVAAGSASADTWLADCDVMIAPGGEVRHPCKLARADLVSDATATLKVTANKTAPLAKSQYQVRDATVVAKAGTKVVATFRVVEISGFGNPDAPDGGWRVRATHWIKLIKDKDALAAAAAGKLPVASAIKAAVAASKSTADQDRSDDEQLNDDLRREVEGNTDVKASLVGWLAGGAILIGSAPNQRLTGKKGGKTVKAWKLTLAQDGGVDLSSGGMAGFAVTHVVATTKVKTATVAITYPTLIVFTQGLTEGGGSLFSQARLISFSVVH